MPDNINGLVSLANLDGFLVELDKKKCPWCDGENWAMRITTETDVTSNTSIKGLRALPLFDMHIEGEQLKGSMHVGTENALPLVVVRCDNCGFLYNFDYFLLAALYNNKKNKPVDSSNEQ